MARLCVPLARAGRSWRTARIRVQAVSRRHDLALPVTVTVTAASHLYPSTTAFDCATEPAANTIRYISDKGSSQCTCDGATGGSWLTSSASRLAWVPLMRMVTGPAGAPIETDAKPVTSAVEAREGGDRGSNVGDEQATTQSEAMRPAAIIGDRLFMHL
jgi:hypothetical protein